MLRALIISDKLIGTNDTEHLNILNGAIEINRWVGPHNLPRPSDYEIVILDMAIGSYNYGIPSNTFFDIAQDIVNLLRAGGIVICLNYFTDKTRKRVTYNPKTSKLKWKEIIPSGVGERYETNYDWIPYEDLLSALNIAEVNAKVGNNFILTTKKKEYIDYFSGVKEYHKILQFMEPKENARGYELKVGDTAFDAEVFALTKVTKKPIACALKIFNGFLIFLPQSTANRHTILNQLYSIGRLEFEAHVDESSNFSLPEWLSNYKCKQEIEIDTKIQQYGEEIQTLKKERQKYVKADYLLFGTGDNLEDAVEFVLRQIGFCVEKTEKGATIDFKANLGKIKFVIEVTGIDDKVFKDNKHFSHILQYLPLAEEDEKIVFMVNTYRNIDITERTSKEHFTSPVIEMSKNNHIALITTSNLFKIWVKRLTGEPVEKIFSDLFVCNGVFDI